MAKKLRGRNAAPDHRLQTKDLAVEIWHQIFRDASHIHSTDEFSTKARLHNRLVWDLDYDENDARVDADSLDEALRTRGKIVLVCKAWYAMGIEILYSHIRIKGILCDDMAFYGLLMDGCRLLHYTKRLTLAPPARKKSPLINTIEHLRRAAWLCSSLPRLQILIVPGDLMASFPLKSLPNTLEVVIFKDDSNFQTFQAPQMDLPARPLPAVWMDVRVLDVSSDDLLPCTRIHSQEIVFSSLEDLSFRTRARWFGEAHDEEVVAHICDSWRAPKLKGFLLCDPNAFHWKEFLVCHAHSLEMLCISTWGQFASRSDDGQEKETIELPNLKALYIDWWEEVPVFIANEVQRVGIHDLGAYSPEDQEKEQCHVLERFEDVYIRWHMYPKITSCCITGWEGLIGWLERQQQGLDFVTEMKEREIQVNFIGMKDEAFGYGDD